MRHVFLSLVLRRRVVRRLASVALLASAALLVFVALAALAAGPARAEQPTPPPITGLTCVTQPDPARWYADPYVVFSWQPTIGALYYSWSLDGMATHTPDTIPESSLVSFAAPIQFGWAEEPLQIQAADLNADGNPDAIIASTTSGGVDVNLGNGSGYFPSGSSPATGNCVDIAAGDVTGDGHMDIVAANGSGTVSVLAGDGTGTVFTKTDFTAGSRCDAVVLADFDGDGKPDIATTNSTASKIDLLLDDGSGSFTSGTSVATGTSPFRIATGDVNGDGKADLATANYYMGGSQLSVLPGNGDGTFGTRTDINLPGGTSVGDIAIADLNGDGKADLVEVGRQNDTVGVLLGIGDGTFAVLQTYTTGDNPNAVVVGDFNGDGKADLATANGANSASVLLGDGSGAFPTHVEFVTDDVSVGIAAADFNRDGRLDLATANIADDTASMLCNATSDAVAAFGPRADGTWYFHLCALGPTFLRGEVSDATVNIDTTAPVTRALAAASARSGARAKLKYQVDDARPGSPTATVTIKIKNARGKVVKTLKLGKRAVNTPLTARFTCTLAKGRYRFVVYATDQAGNAQARAGGNRLTVR
jgi:hypothetical protein